MRVRFAPAAELDDALAGVWGAGVECAGARERIAALGCDLTLTSEGLPLGLDVRGTPELRPLAEALARRAPVAVETHRPGEALETVVGRIEAGEPGGLSRARFRAGLQRGHLVDVVVHTANCVGTGDERASTLAVELVLGVAGDLVFERWIGDVDVSPLPRGTGLLRVHDIHAPVEGTTHPVAELPGALARAIDAVRAALPAEPCHARSSGAEWTMFDLEPSPLGGIAAQDDLVVATTMMPEMLKCFLEGAPFASERFSRHCERFCYVKLPGNDLGRRDALDERLGVRLLASGLGAIIGTGVGLEHSYLDLAVVDVDRAVDIVCDALRSADAPRETTVLFCDTEWSDEWVGVWPDTPAPAR